MTVDAVHLMVERGRAFLLERLRQPIAELPGGFALSFWDARAEVMHSQIFMDGRFIDWQVGRTSAPLAFVNSPDEIAHLLEGRDSGESAFNKLRVRFAGSDLVDHIPPFDAATNDAFDRAPEIPGVMSTVGLHFDKTPFGALDVTIAVTDGRPKILASRAADADVTANLDFVLVLRYLAGEVGFMDMLHGGSIEGQWPKLMLVAGVIESAEFQAGISPMKAAYDHLIAVVRVLDDDLYRRSLIEVLSRVEV